MGYNEQKGKIVTTQHGSVAYFFTQYDCFFDLVKICARKFQRQEQETVTSLPCGILFTLFLEKFSPKLQVRNHSMYCRQRI